ncbi:MAG: hypothetical protein AAF182_01535 [Pseudomonadota bacterium]
MVDAESIQRAIKNLEFPDDLEVSEAAARTAETVQVYCAFVRKTSTTPEREKDDKTVQLVYKKFFDFADSWLINTRTSSPQQNQNLNAADLKRRAQEAISDIQDNIVRFALVYMHIDRCLGIVQSHIAKYGQDAKAKTFKWTQDTGDVLRRVKKQRIELGDVHKRLTEGLKYAAKLEPKYAEIEKMAYKFKGKDQGDRALRGFRTAIRLGDFDKARQRLVDITEDKKGLMSMVMGGGDAKGFISKGNIYIDDIIKSQDYLKDSEGKYFFNVSEITVALGGLEKELEQKDGHIKKYYGPYLENKRKRLVHLREKLLVFGSLQGLITLYMKLIRGLATPLDDVKKVREYEADVIQHVDYILSGQFQEINNIERRTGEELEEFFTATSIYKDVKKLQKIKEKLDEAEEAKSGKK